MLASFGERGIVTEVLIAVMVYYSLQIINALVVLVFLKNVALKSLAVDYWDVFKQILNFNIVVLNRGFGSNVRSHIKPIYRECYLGNLLVGEFQLIQLDR